MEKHMNEVLADNKRLAEPLQRAKDEVDELKRELANYEKDKQALAVRHVTGVMTSAVCGVVTRVLVSDDEGEVAHDGDGHEEPALGARSVGAALPKGFQHRTVSHAPQHI